MFIYAIIGMNFFLNVKLINGLTETQNFQTFGKSMITLFRISTGAGLILIWKIFTKVFLIKNKTDFEGWNELLTGLSLSNQDPGFECEDGFDIQSLSSGFKTNQVNGCGSFGLGIAYLVTL
jgi:hypothetical protein